MYKIDFENMSAARKVIFTILGILYGLAMLGNARHGNIAAIVGVTLFFFVIVQVIFLWVK